METTTTKVLIPKLCNNSKPATSKSFCLTSDTYKVFKQLKKLARKRNARINEEDLVSEMTELYNEKYKLIN
jgi:hypothetical protein